MRFSYGVSGVLITVAALKLACGRVSGGAGSPDAGDVGTGAGFARGLPSDFPPRIQTLQLRPARVGQAYAERLTVRNGTPPFTWLGSGTDAELGWLTLAPSTGALTGVPGSMSLGDHVLSIQVQDSADGGRVASASWRLRVVECEGEAVEACFIPSSSLCMQGERACVDGGWAGCAPRAASLDVSACGPTCGVCGPGANTCRGGACACGAGEACAGDAPDCCPDPDGGSCTHLLWNPDSCGACGARCDAGSRLHVARTCDQGACEFPCEASRYQDCDNDPSNGCEADLQSPLNCGNCGKSCSSSSTCVDGGCVPCQSCGSTLCCPPRTCSGQQCL